VSSSAARGSGNEERIRARQRTEVLLRLLILFDHLSDSEGDESSRSSQARSA
jgi:hypothetical protein